MTTTAQAIAALVESKAVLQARCDGASGETLNQLIATIQNITSEIGALAASALINAPYVPGTDAFKVATASAQSFLATLSALQRTFTALASVANALDSVVKLVTKLGL